MARARVERAAARESEEEEEVEEEEGKLFQVQEDALHEYLTRMRLDGLFTELVEELLVEAPENPVKFMIDYLFTQFPDQAHASSFARTFPDAANAVGAGVPLTGIAAASAFATASSDDEAEEVDEATADSAAASKLASSGSASPPSPPGKRAESGPLGGSRRHAILFPRQQQQQQQQRQSEGSPLRSSHRAELKQLASSNALLRQLPAPQLEEVLTDFMLFPFQAGAQVCAAGELCDCFYFVAEGQCIHKVDGKTVLTSNTGDGFGEMALIHDAPCRTTVIVASEFARLYGISGAQFRKIVRRSREQARNANVRLLRAVPIFATLGDVELQTLAEDVAIPMTFSEGETIVKQHAPSDKFLVLLEGEVRCEQKLSPASPGVPVATLRRGDYFGEVALITDRPRAASVVAISSRVRCLAVPRDAFLRVFGPLTDLIRRDEALFRRFISDKI